MNESEIQAQKHFLQALMSKDAAQLLWEDWRSGRANEAFPGLFPDQPCGEAKLLQEYLQGMDKLPFDRDLRLALMLLCCKTSKAWLAIASLDKEVADQRKLILALAKKEEFCFVDSIYKVKRFLYHYGEETFKFLQKISEQQVILHGQPEIRSVARREYFILIKQSKDPVYEEDLVIDAQRLLALGLAEKRIPETLAALVDFVHRFPHANTESVLWQKAQNINANLAVKLIKKFLGKY